MSLSRTAAILSLSILVLGLGCSKNESTPDGAPGTTGATGSTAAPVTASPAASAAMAELSGTYNALSDTSDGSSMKRHQALMLKIDGTAELDTSVVDSGKPNAVPKSSDQATGTYSATAQGIVATFTMKDGKPIPTSDDKRILRLTREHGDKSLMSADGRTFERAK